MRLSSPTPAAASASSRRSSLPLSRPRASMGEVDCSNEVKDDRMTLRLLNLAEIADGAVYFISQGGLLPSSRLSIICEANRRGRSRRNNSSDKISKETDKLKDPLSNEGTLKSSSQEEILSLFRRIQSSISKGEKGSKKRSSSNLKDKQSAKSTLGALQKFPTRKQARDKTPSREEIRVSHQIRKTSEDKIAEDAPPSGNFKVSRPVSNFVKKSPIPQPLSTKENTKDVAEKQTTAAIADKGLELQKLNEMKLSELKDLARTKGIKGYSKLKKGELLELLEGLLQSSS